MGCQQIDSIRPLSVTFSPTGRTSLRNHYFKTLCELDHNKDKNNHVIPGELELDKVNAIENSHYYLNWFALIAHRIYFIDYPDHCVPGVVEVFIQKQHQGDVKNFIEVNRETLPVWAKDKLTEQNFLEIFSLLWLKQLKIWRLQSGLKPIMFKDFFNPQIFQSIVKQVIGRPIVDIEQFDSTYSDWIQHNDTLRKLIS